VPAQDEEVAPGNMEIVPTSGALTIESTAGTVVQNKSGYVALLDVLGFRSIVAGDHKNAAVIKYLTVITESLKHTSVESIVFSDTIVLTKDGPDPENLRLLCQICSRLMLDLISANIPIRGAIAYGEFARSNIGASAFLAGKPIIEAYEYEQKQNWIGMMLTPSAIQGTQSINLPKHCDTSFQNDEAFANLAEYLKWKAYIQRCAAIPFHGEPGSQVLLHDGCAIVPGGSTSLDEMMQNIRAVGERLEWLKMLARTPADQGKYTATIEWLRQLGSSWGSRQAEYTVWKSLHPQT
jgi:hypothetical protein